MVGNRHDSRASPNRAYHPGEPFTHDSNSEYRFLSYVNLSGKLPCVHCIRESARAEATRLGRSRIGKSQRESVLDQRGLERKDAFGFLAFGHAPLRLTVHHRLERLYGQRIELRSRAASDFAKRIFNGSRFSIWAI